MTERADEKYRVKHYTSNYFVVQRLVFGCLWLTVRMVMDWPGGDPLMTSRWFPSIHVGHNAAVREAQRIATMGYRAYRAEQAERWQRAKIHMAEYRQRKRAVSVIDGRLSR